MVKERSKPDNQFSSDLNTGNRLLLFNDEQHTFDYVIDTLMEVCGHEPEQAEQCALIAHIKGKCVVKSGESDSLKTMRQELTTRGLTVSVE